MLGVKQLALLEALFGPIGGGDSIPLFPTKDGGYVTAEVMVELVDLFAHMTGESICDDFGEEVLVNTAGAAAGPSSCRPLGSTFIQVNY